MATRPTARKVKYTRKSAGTKKQEPFYDAYFANSSSGVKEARHTIGATYNKNWKETPKWQRVKIPLKPKYTSKKSR